MQENPQSIQSAEMLMLLASQNMMQAACRCLSFVKLLIDVFCSQIFQFTVDPHFQVTVWYGVRQSSGYHTFGTCETPGALIL